jgi:hypothetical protein
MKAKSSQPTAPLWSRHSKCSSTALRRATRCWLENGEEQKGGVNDMTLAVLHDIRAATLDYLSDPIVRLFAIASDGSSSGSK